MSRARYQETECVCCKGKWRIRVNVPALKRSRVSRYVTIWKIQVICGWCNSAECGGSYSGGIIPCNRGRQD